MGHCGEGSQGSPLRIVASNRRLESSQCFHFASSAPLCVWVASTAGNDFIGGEVGSVPVRYPVPEAQEPEQNVRRKDSHPQDHDHLEQNKTAVEVASLFPAFISPDVSRIAIP